MTRSTLRSLPLTPPAPLRTHHRSGPHSDFPSHRTPPLLTQSRRFPGQFRPLRTPFRSLWDSVPGLPLARQESEPSSVDVCLFPCALICWLVPASLGALPCARLFALLLFS